MATLLLARHGQASFGQENYDQLSTLGAKQAGLLGRHYAASGRQIDAMVTGSLSRQQDSAMFFLQEYHQVVDGDASITPDMLSDFNEFNHQDVFIKFKPEFQSKEGIMAELAKSDVPKQRLAELFNDAMIRWHSGDYDSDYIESWHSFNERAQQALSLATQKIQNIGSDKTLLVFTSGGVISAIASRLLGQGSQTAYQINRSLVNAGVTTVSIQSDGTPRLLALNEHSHLFSAGEKYITWH